MFQWMGGSRRKVTTSRKSTHKRQKQYFEQKKRQLQQQPDWQDISIIGENASREEKNYKSLDVTSLLNLTEKAKECESSCLDDKFMEIVNYSKDHDGLLSSEIPTDSRKDVDKKMVQEFPKIFTHHGSGRNNGSMDNCQTFSQTTILDILADDGPNFEFRQHPTYESHVTFSFEDVGKVRAKTIDNSSPQHGRVPHCNYSTRKHPTYKKFDSLNDDFEFGTMKITDHCNRYWKSPLQSPGRVDSFLPTRQDFSSLEAMLKDEKIYNKSIDFIGKDNFFSCELGSDSAWNDKSSLLDDSLPDESLFHASDCIKPWKNLPFELDDFSVEFLHDGNHSLPPDTGFKHGIKRRYVKESTNTFGTFSIAEDDEDITNLWRPGVGRHDFFDNLINQPSHPSFMDGDMKDLPSEESCSSSAVMEEGNNFPSHPIKGEQRGRRARPVKTYRAESFLSHESRTPAADGPTKPKTAPSSSWMRSVSRGPPVFDMPYPTPPEARRVSDWAQPSSFKNFDIETGFSFLKPEKADDDDPFAINRPSSSLLGSHNFPGFSDTSPLPSAAEDDVPEGRGVGMEGRPLSAMEVEGSAPTARRSLNMNFGTGGGGGGGSVSSKNEKPDVNVCNETKVEPPSPVHSRADEFGGKTGEKNGLEMSQYTQEGGVDGTTMMTMTMESHILRLLLVQKVTKSGTGSGRDDKGEDL